MSSGDRELRTLFGWMSSRFEVEVFVMDALRAVRTSSVLLHVVLYSVIAYGSALLWPLTRTLAADGSVNRALPCAPFWLGLLYRFAFGNRVVDRTGRENGPSGQPKFYIQNDRRSPGLWPPERFTVALCRPVVPLPLPSCPLPCKLVFVALLFLPILWSSFRST